MASIIEVLLNVKDQSQRGLNAFKRNISGLKSLAAGAGLVLLTKNIIEAEDAMVQLDAAFAATGKTAGITRTRLDDLATTIQQTTRFSDDLVREAEAILLTFDKVRGQAFERTILVATDLAARMKTDLVTAVRSVGFALQDPERGLDRLRRAGVSVSKELRETVKNLIATGQVSKAQTTILAELERRFQGSAAAARNTLGGALIGLKNAFGDLFEGTRESTAGTTKSINDLSKALSDPQLKVGIDNILSGFSTLVTLLVKTVSLLGQAQSKLLDFAKTKGPTASTLRGLASSVPFLGPLATYFEASSRAGEARTERTGGYGGRGSRETRVDNSVDVEMPEALQEVNIALKRIGETNDDVMQELIDSTRIGTRKVAGEYTKLKETLDFLNDQQLITSRQRSEIIGEALDEMLPEFDLNAIRSMYKTVQRETTELGEFMKGVWQGVGNSIRSVIADMFYNWDFSLRGIVDVARRAAAEIAAAFATAGIRKAALSLFSSFIGTGDQSELADSFFAFRAGGGYANKPFWAGEEGRELVVPTGSGAKVYNKRQLGGIGSGAVVTYAPTNNISVIEKDDSRKTKEEILSTVAMMQSKNNEELVKILERSGLSVRT
jgi:hypothetical protein